MQARSSAQIDLRGPARGHVRKPRRRCRTASHVAVGHNRTDATNRRPTPLCACLTYPKRNGGAVFGLAGKGKRGRREEIASAARSSRRWVAFSACAFHGAKTRQGKTNMTLKRLMRCERLRPCAEQSTAPISSDGCTKVGASMANDLRSRPRSHRFEYASPQRSQTP